MQYYILRHTATSGLGMYKWCTLVATGLQSNIISKLTFANRSLVESWKYYDVYPVNI